MMMMRQSIFLLALLVQLFVPALGFASQKQMRGLGSKSADAGRHFSRTSVSMGPGYFIRGSGEVHIVYGAIIEIPQEPLWAFMLYRLGEGFGLTSEGDFNNMSNASVPILLSRTDMEELSQYEKDFIDDEDGMPGGLHLFLPTAFEKRIASILKEEEDVLVEMKVLPAYVAYSTWRSLAVDPVLVLSYSKATFLNRRDTPSGRVFEMPCLDDDEKARIHRQMDKVLDAFELKTAGSKGWNVISSEPKLILPRLSESQMETLRIKRVTDDAN